MSGWDLAVWLERQTANAEVATVLGSIPASSDTVESEGRQMNQCWIQYVHRNIKIQKIPLLKLVLLQIFTPNWRQKSSTLIKICANQQTPM